MEHLPTRLDDLTAKLTRLLTQLLMAVRSVGAWVTMARPNDQRGQGLAEYALILAFIAIVAIAALAFFGLQLSGVLTDPVGAELQKVVDELP